MCKVRCWRCLLGNKIPITLDRDAEIETTWIIWMKSVSVVPKEVVHSTSSCFQIVIDSGLVGCLGGTHDNTILTSHLPRIVYHQVYNVYSDELVPPTDSGVEGRGK